MAAFSGHRGRPTVVISIAPTGPRHLKRVLHELLRYYAAIILTDLALGNDSPTHIMLFMRTGVQVGWLEGFHPAWNRRRGLISRHCECTEAICRFMRIS